MKIEVGDKVFCINSIISRDGNRIVTFEKVYEILEVNQVLKRYWIMCDNGEKKFVSDFDFKDYFIDLCEYRKRKLRKINNR